MLSESRLIGYTIEQIKKMQQNAGVTPTISGTTRVSAQSNAAAQNTTHQAALQQNQQNQGQFVGNLNPQTGIVQSTPITPPSEPAPFRWGDQYNPGDQADNLRYNNELLRQEQIKQEMERDAAKSRAMGVIPPALPQQTLGGFQPFGNRTSAEGMKANLDRQSFIEQKRAEGMSDAQIRTLINTLPPEQTGGVPAAATPAQPQAAPTATPQATEAGPQAPAAPTSTPTGKKGEGEAPVGPVASPGTNLLRNIAATVQDPILKAILLAEADQADAMGNPTAMSQGQFLAGADAAAISKPYDAIDKILDRADATAKKVYASQEAFLKGQYDRNEKLMAAEQENIKNQLSFAQDKGVRDLADANKKMLDSQTIMLALQGGFGSSDGNREILEARLKGEEAIVNLNKEFGFKNTDVSLKFSEMHNQAFDSYQQAWLQATDNFENRVSQLDLQGISNQQAKSNALSGAYKEYTTEIKNARIEHANKISNATKMVLDVLQNQRESKIMEDRWEYEKEWDQYVFEQNSAFKAQDLAADSEERQLRRDERQDTLDTKRDDTERYKSETKAAELTRLMDGDDVLKKFRDARSSWDSLETAFKEVGNPFRDRALAKSYEKLVEVGSVVMPGEYADITSSAPLANKVIGKISQVINGGQKWTDAEREALYDIGKSLNEAYARRADEASQKFYMQIDFHNRNVLNPAHELRPSMIGLPERTTSDQRRSLEDLAEPGLFPDNPIKVNDFNAATDLQSGIVGGKTIKAQPYVLSALQRADIAMYEATGQHIQVNEHFRDSATQTRLYKNLSAKGARVAPPGKSFHEKGLALDIANWKEAAPYLARYGLVNGLKDDMGHFSIGEMNPQVISALSNHDHAHRS